MDPGAAKDPVFILLDGTGTDALLRISPEDEPSGRFRYRANVTHAHDERLDCVARGDEMLLDPGCITILRRGRAHAYFPLNAFLWWERKVFHEDFWQRCLALRMRDRSAGDKVAISPSAEARIIAASKESLRLKAALACLFSSDGRDRPRFAGFELESVRTSEKPRLELILRRQARIISLYVEKKNGARPCYAEAGGFAVYFSNETPVDSPDKDAAIRDFARRLAGLHAGGPV
jgi:hypothetical protein